MLCLSTEAVILIADTIHKIGIQYVSLILMLNLGISKGGRSKSTGESFVPLQNYRIFELKMTRGII